MYNLVERIVFSLKNTRKIEKKILEKGKNGNHALYPGPTEFKPDAFLMKFFGIVGER